ncbi:DUF4177 domain-containing protein [Shimia biformata]|uniref:DUF4177 domain-containing protein n=1 Tax=Shimia biformata TaxID=1294299 RepID=UPI00194F8650|nr:DUF4177 domain-containing protein [Shimia biformata]
MTVYEYKVVPAPMKGKKAKGIKTAEDRFAFALEDVMNQMAADGWEFQRSETLPSQERSGLTSSTTQFRSVMVFRRPSSDDISGFEPRVLDMPDVAKLAAPEGDGDSASDGENGTLILRHPTKTGDGPQTSDDAPDNQDTAKG